MTTRKYITALISIALIFLSANSFANSDNTGEETKAKPAKDTIPAMVLYGDKFLFQQVDYLSRDKVVAFRDSLADFRGFEDDLVHQVTLYLSITEMDDTQVVQLIDSLFELEKIPYPLINQINLYIVNRPLEIRETIEEFIDTSEFPADYFYHSWNTINPNPYLPKLSRHDSTVLLDLTKGGGENYFAMPKKGVLTSPFGWREGKSHNGIDIDLEVWDTVVTAFAGMVRVAKFFGGYGRVVVVRHFNGLETTYAHLHRIKVKAGKLVSAGEMVGLGGSSGNSTGSHLHFECRFKGYPLNPLNFISSEENNLITDTLVLKKTKYGFAAFPIGAEFHLVRKGEYLAKIAQMYGTTTRKLCELNSIRRNKILRVGEKIRVI
ncbi:MAG: hypothetical protein COA57_02545 [Flavobacteriales bacterium]|nr:MAG: hypothetical protein COA57_02545 [Flavobacteriales bacterium]